MNLRNKIIAPLVAIFIIFCGLLITFRGLLFIWGIDYGVLIVANIILFLISLIVFFIQQKALYSTNPHVFVRSVMGGMLIKMFVCIVAVLVYRLVAGAGTNKLSVFAAMFLYLAYLAVEVAAITKLNKQKNA